MLRSLASLQSVGYLRALMADHAWVEYHEECGTETEFGGENYSISHIGCVNIVWLGRPRVPALAVRDHTARMVWERHTATRPPCAYLSGSRRGINSMIFMVLVYIFQQSVEVTAC